MASRILKATLVFLAFALPATADQGKGPCIEACFTNNPTSAGCKGTETGDELDACTCKLYRNIFSVPAFVCIGNCAVEEQKTFFNAVPDACRAFVLRYYSGPGGSSEPTPTSTKSSARSTATSSTNIAAVTTSAAAVTSAAVAGASSTLVGAATSVTTSVSTTSTAKSNAISGLRFDVWNVGVVVGGVAIMVL
jgi:hypothetical protein